MPAATSKVKYGMAVSNQEWRNDQRYRNVCDAMKATGAAVRVISTTHGWPTFETDVVDVICPANIEDYCVKCGLMEAPVEVVEEIPPPADTPVFSAEYPLPGDAPVGEPEMAPPPVRTSKAAITLAIENDIDPEDVPFEGAIRDVNDVRRFLAAE